MADAPAGSLLRALGVDLPKQQGDVKALEGYIVDLGLPNIPVGQIKRLSQALRKGSPEAQKLRKAMSAENRLRGAADQEDYVDTLLRSTPFHGRSYEHYPQTGEVYNPGIAKAGNIGEPQGLSLTYRDPKKFVSEHSSFAKSPKKYAEARKRLYTAYEKLPRDFKREELQARIQSLETEQTFRAKDIEEVTPVKDWDVAISQDAQIKTIRNEIDTVTEQINKLPTKTDLSEKLRKATVKAKLKESREPPIARVFPRFHGRPSEHVVKGWKGSGDEEVLKEAYTYALKQMPELWSGGSAHPKEWAEDFSTMFLPSYQSLKANMGSKQRQDFNTHLTDYLKSKGYRGVLYSPQRYNEYELRMLESRDVIQQDIRQVDDPALRRMFEPKSIFNHDYYETRVSKQDSKKTNAINEWKTRSDYQANPYQESGHQPYALGAIYQDIDMSKLRLDSNEVRHVLAEEVKTKVLDQLRQTKKAGLGVGKIGDTRVKQDPIPEFSVGKVPPEELIEDNLITQLDKILPPLDK